MVQVGATDKIVRYPPKQAWWKVQKLLGLWAGIRTRSSVQSTPIARDLIPISLLYTTHVTRLHSRPPVDTSPCLRYTTVEPHHEHITNEQLCIKPPGVLKTGRSYIRGSLAAQAHMQPSSVARRLVSCASDTHCEIPHIARPGHHGLCAPHQGMLMRAFPWRQDGSC